MCHDLHPGPKTTDPKPNRPGSQPIPREGILTLSKGGIMMLM